MAELVVMTDPVEWIEHKLAQVDKVVKEEAHRQREYPTLPEDEPLYCIDDDYHHPLTGDPLTIITLAAATRRLLEEHQPIVAVSEFPQLKSGQQWCSRCCDYGVSEWEPLPWPCDSIKAIAGGWGWTDGWGWTEEVER